MNETKHTPEPWRHESPTSLLVLGGDDSNEEIVAGCWGKGALPLEGRANARRIVACVNACASIDTAWLEGAVERGLTGLYEWSKDSIDLYKARQLIHALVTIHNVVGDDAGGAFQTALDELAEFVDVQPGAPAMTT